MKDNIKNVKKWTIALRSGEYEQGRGALVTIDRHVEAGETGYCCLGVACMVYEKETGDKLPSMFRSGGTLEGSLSMVSDWLGLGHDFENILIALNDRGITDFNGIADIIEDHLNKDKAHD